MSATIPITIGVQTQYLADQSSPEDKRFVFAYTITINNESEESVQLLRRHWLITDGNEKVQEVEGDGVVGEQPLIAAGASYRYTSGAVLETAMGTMEGSYQMCSASGDTFDAPIDLFPLVHPMALH